MPTRRAFGLAALCLTLVLLASPARAQGLDPAFRADVEKLLEITGSAKMGVQMATIVSSQILDGMRKSDPQVPERVLSLAKEVLEAEFGKAFTDADGLMPELVRIYAKAFTREEVRGLITFYESDLGKKLVGTLPVLVQESAAAGQAWGEKNVPRITSTLHARLKAEGYIK